LPSRTKTDRPGIVHDRCISWKKYAIDRFHCIFMSSQRFKNWPIQINPLVIVLPPSPVCLWAVLNIGLDLPVVFPFLIPFPDPGFSPLSHSNPHFISAHSACLTFFTPLHYLVSLLLVSPPFLPIQRFQFSPIFPFQSLLTAKRSFSRACSFSNHLELAFPALNHCSCL
jgi:hypothetical protein